MSPNPPEMPFKTAVIGLVAVVFYLLGALVFWIVLVCLVKSVTNEPCGTGRGGLPLLVIANIILLWQTTFYIGWFVTRLIRSNAVPWFENWSLSGISYDEVSVRRAMPYLIGSFVFVIGSYLGPPFIILFFFRFMDVLDERYRTREPARGHENCELTRHCGGPGHDLAL